MYKEVFVNLISACGELHLMWCYKTNCVWYLPSVNSFLQTPSTSRHERGFEITILVVTGTDCTGSCKSKYHKITTTMTLQWYIRIKIYIETWLKIKNICSTKIKIIYYQMNILTYLNYELSVSSSENHAGGNVW
jgi:hypothetical protein